MGDDERAGPGLPALDRRLLFRASLGLLALGGLPELAGCGPTRAVASSASSPTALPTITAGGVPLRTAAPADTPGNTAVVRTGPVSDGLRPVYVDAARVRIGVSQVGVLDAVVAGMQNFATHLYSVSATATQNWTVSPLSIAVAVGMLRAGARGATGAQLDAAFGFPRTSAPQGSPHPALNALTAELVTTSTSHPSPTDSFNGPPVVALANGLFVADGSASSILPAYLALLAQQYGAHAIGVDFTKHSAVEVINAWVSRQTRGRIPNILSELDPATLLVLANAVYLKAAWLEQFDKAQTRTATFRTASGTTVQARTMRKTLQDAGYASTADWQRVTMSYAGGELSMRVVVPTRMVTDVAALGALLPVATAPNRADDQGGADQAVLVDMRLPRWNTSTQLDLRTLLPRLGVTDVFNPARADLDGIVAGGGLSVDQAVHEANVTVTEKGTVAAAATVIQALALSLHVPPARPRTVHVHADRPFVWAIVHEPTGTPVFTGHVVDPTQQVPRLRLHTDHAHDRPRTPR